MKVIEVSAGLVFRDGRLLITQRPAGGHLAGLWEFPGGKRDPDESFEECLRRELREELAIEVVVHELVESIDHVYPEKSVHLRFFRCAWKAQEPQAIGCADFKWVTAAELSAHAFPPADEKLLARLAQEQKWWR